MRVDYMYKVFVVEDSFIVWKIVNKFIEDNFYFMCDLCEDFVEVKSVFESDIEYLVVIVDLNFFDVFNGESVEFVFFYNVLIIVFIGNFDEFICV